MNLRIRVVRASTVMLTLLALPGCMTPAVAAPLASQTILRSTPNPAVEGALVTFTAAVTFTGSRPATGAITLKDNAQVLGTITLDATGGGTFATASLAVGQHNLVASYSGDSEYAPSNSEALIQTINSLLTPTSTTLSSSITPATTGQSVTFSAVVKTTTSSTFHPTGTVRFYAGATLLGSSDVVSSGGGKIIVTSASLTTSALPAGSQNIQAVYSGDNVFAGSVSAILVQVVQLNPHATATTLNSSGTLVMFGQALNFTVQVTSSFGAPTGSITLTDGGSVLGQMTLDVSGQANLTTAALSVGRHAITAAYGGDANFAASTSATVIVNVQPRQAAGTTTVLTASDNPAALGHLIVLSASVSKAFAMPTGSVTFKDNSSVLATVTLDNGVATLDWLSFTAGIHLLSAEYSGDIVYAASSGILLEVVNKPFSVPTAIVVTSSSNPSTYGDAISFVATVSGNGDTPTGTVAFTVGSNVVTVSLDNTGTAVFTTSALSSGTNSVSAVYSGDASFGGSISPLLPQEVNPALLTITASSASMAYGATPPAIVASVSGFVPGETVANLTTPATCSTTATATSLAGTYPSTCSGAAGVNYTISYVDGVVTVIAPPPNSAPLVTTQPASQTAVAGGNVSFTAAASGNPKPTVQWQVSANGGVKYNNIPGATSTTYTVGATLALDGNLYRAGFTNSSGSVLTNAATLTVNSAPSVTTNPGNQSVIAGANATFSAAATGKPTPTVQWQISADNGATYSNVAGATSTTYVVVATIALNGARYRAVFTNSIGSATTNAAALTVTPSAAPVVITQPVSQTVTAGAIVTLNAAASGAPTPTVRWQVSTNGGTSFTNITGATSAVYKLVATAAMNGNQYRAVFTNSISWATTNAATLTVNFAPVISAQPLTQSVVAGSNATFTAAANGNPAPTVQWQVSTTVGGAYSNIAGATSNAYTVAATVAMTGYRYRAVFTNSIGSATTSAAILTVH